MKVSIVTICYNAGVTIEKTIKSVLQQTYENIEYIIVDGCSTDNTMEIVEKYKCDKMIVISEPDKGISDAFNKGIQMATGDIIGLINADDFYFPDAVMIVAEAFLSDDIDIVYGDTIVIDNENKLNLFKYASSIEDIEYELPFIHQSSFVKKNTYKKYGLYLEKYKLCMDYEFFARLYHKGATFKHTHHILSCFVYGGASCKHPIMTINENIQIAKIYGLSSKKAFVYKCKIIFRNLIKILLVKLGLWERLFKKFKKKSVVSEGE